MPPTVCVVATGTLTGLYVFFIVVVFCLHKWRNWRVKLDLTKVYAGDPKCTSYVFAFLHLQPERSSWCL